MSTQKQSTKGNWFGRMCGLMLPRKSPATSTSQDSQHLDTNGSSSRSPPSLPTSPAKGTSPVQPNATMNQSSTVPGPTGVGEKIGHASCIDRSTHWSITNSTPKFLPLRTFQSQLGKVRPMVYQSITLEPVSRTVSWICATLTKS